MASLGEELLTTVNRLQVGFHPSGDQSGFKEHVLIQRRILFSTPLETTRWTYHKLYVMQCTLRHRRSSGEHPFLFLQL